jgi:TDG/mug DNA glycosylase family protein
MAFRTKVLGRLVSRKNNKYHFFMPEQRWKPTKEQILDAHGKKMVDVIAPGLKILFCGINPGLYSAAVGHHFARPGNRFWPTLYASGFTDRLFSAFEDYLLLANGYGITNVVERATASASELKQEEYVKGGKRLEAKVRKYRPRAVAVLGVVACRTAFEKKDAVIGRQEEELGGVSVWILPNPSGLNAHYKPEDLAREYKKMRIAVEKDMKIGA